jgi:exodeoxyribonuclease V gamma subunit
MLGVAPRAGDRNLREDDRQLFLDLFMAAQDRLILTYTGRAARDNSPCAPSVVLDELLDHLDGRSGGQARSALVVQHPLQPFSERYVNTPQDSRLFTFSDTAARAATAGTVGGEAAVTFVTRSIPEPADATTTEVPLRDLSALWENPSRWFCRQVLRLSIPEDDDSPADTERFVLGHMEKGAVRQRMLGAALGTGRDAELEKRRLIADGELPPGELGVAWHARIATEVEFVLAACPVEVRTAATLLVRGSNWRVTGAVDRIVNGARYVIRAGSFRAKHRIRAWVEHVTICAARQQGALTIPSKTVLIGKERTNGVDKIVREEIAEVPNAVAILEGWMKIVAEARRAPLPFFPMAANACFDAMCVNAEIASQLAKGKKSRKKERDLESVAHKAFKSTRYYSGDETDAYLMLCFRGADPLADNFAEFTRLTALLFEPWWTIPQVTL